MLANVPNTQVHRYSCTFFSHVPCYVREHTVEEHHRTHSLTHSHTYLLTYLHTKKKKKKKKKKKIDSRLYSWRQNRTFVHTNEFSTSFPHFSGVFHMFSTFPHFIHTFSTFFWSFPHSTNIHIYAYIHKVTNVCIYK